MPGNCSRCSKVVYFNEEKNVLGKSYHKSCFLCANTSCKRKLDSGNLTTHDDEIYCKVCYGRLFGPKGYGYGVGAGVLNMDNAVKTNGTTRNTPETAKAFMAPKMDSRPASSNSNHSDGPKFGGADRCPRCDKVVYLAEKMAAGGKSWHKMSCFNCAECHKRLESTILCEKEGEIYCKSCYGKNWGPKGYGHGLNPVAQRTE
ncbi:cysteine and glycine-rich protein 1-like [Brevipalpus obovatus]|uniref:cysteine and glycine-rich protein 1-like n=1 Tax=Brevipalpus obovatus TaxID=246614 RepID=UPI003D9E03CD